MLFQYGAGTFGNVFYNMQQWGVFDVLIPFVLIFTILYAVLSKAAIFSEKRYNSIIAVAITLIVIIPHVLGTYPPGMDVINIINNSLPEVALLIVAVVLLMIMTGLLYGEWPTKKPISAIAAALGGILIIGIFLSNFFTIPILSYIDPQIQSVLIVLIIFGLVFLYVTSDGGSGSKTVGEHIGSLFKDMGT